MRPHRKRTVKQHYVPQCYLRQFATKHKKAHRLQALDRKSGKSYKDNVKDVACQNYFNRIAVDGMDHEALEKALSEFETELADALRRIDDARSLENAKDRAYLITFDWDDCSPQSGDAGEYPRTA